jgi:hypothetical protein
MLMLMVIMILTLKAKKISDSHKDLKSISA